MQHFHDLVVLVQQLRDPASGCAWNKAQTPASLLPYLLEEVYEYIHAVQSQDHLQMRAELGDILFQVLLHCTIGRELEIFDLDQVSQELAEKLIDRHPHVFSDNPYAGRSQWAAQKQATRVRQGLISKMDDIPKAQPSLMRAQKTQCRAAEDGFDWDDIQDVFDKINEEIDEVHEAISDKGNIAEEIGDLLFAVSNLSRQLGFDSEQLLAAATDKFANRYRYMEQCAEKDGAKLQDYSLAQKEHFWQEAKLNLKK